MAKTNITEESPTEAVLRITALEIRDNFRQIRYNVVQALLKLEPDAKKDIDIKAPEFKKLQNDLDKDLIARQSDIEKFEKLDIDEDLKTNIKKEIKEVSEGLKAILLVSDKTEKIRADSLDRQKRFDALIKSVEKDAADMRSKVAGDLVFMLANNKGVIDQSLLTDLERGLSAKRDGTKPVVSLEAIRSDAIDTLEGLRKNGILAPNDTENDKTINEYINKATKDLVLEINDDKKRQKLLTGYVQKKAMLQSPFFDDVIDPTTGQHEARTILKQNNEVLIEKLSTHVDFSSIDMSQLLKNSGAIVNEVGPIVQKNMIDFFGKPIEGTVAYTYDQTKLDDNKILEAFADKLKSDINVLALGTQEERLAIQNRNKEQYINQIIDTSFEVLTKNKRTLDDAQKRLIREKIATTLEPLDSGYLMHSKHSIQQHILGSFNDTNLGKTSLVSRILGNNKLEPKQLETICAEVRDFNMTAQERLKEKDAPSIVSSKPSGQLSTNNQEKHDATIHEVTHNQQFNEIRRAFNYNKPLPKPPEQFATNLNDKKPLPPIPNADPKALAPTPQAKKKEPIKIGNHRNAQRVGGAAR